MAALGRTDRRSGDEPSPAKPALPFLLRLSTMNGLALILAWAIVHALSGLAPPAGGSAGDEPWLDPLPVRPVRVLVARNVSQLRLRSASAVIATGELDPRESRISLRRWTVVESASAGEITIGRQSFTGPAVTLRSVTKPGVSIWLSVQRDGEWSPGRAYPGSLTIRLHGDGSLRVVNAVHLETYVGCVTGNEVWPTFHREAYRAQAIVARTFVLSRMRARRGARYDLVATEAAQVYRGWRDDDVGRRGREAARDTRGLVCAARVGDRITLFPTYYSSACGGVTQAGSVFGAGPELTPLQGNVPCDYCQIAPGQAYAWEPVSLELAEVLRRLQARSADFADWTQLTDIGIARWSAGGRPTHFYVTGAADQRRELDAESFRLAIGSRVLRSTYCQVLVQGTQVQFFDGHGFGHGVGLCQWGMEGQARAGKSALDILRYYYPEVVIRRAY